MQTEYTKVKVNNEIELCETVDMEVKQQIERVLLQNRISYYIKWHKQGIFRHGRNLCTICINDNSRNEAEELIRSLGEDVESRVKFLMRKSNDSFF
ncbi:MAG: hypothetical protein J1E83_00715 [Lachnospiraceae bacterium]|nr:hypothetical protein [Lachnospiraceae bacterium]